MISIRSSTGKLITSLTSFHTAGILPMLRTYRLRWNTLYIWLIFHLNWSRGLSNYYQNALNISCMIREVLFDLSIVGSNKTYDRTWIIRKMWKIDVVLTAVSERSRNKDRHMDTWYVRAGKATEHVNPCKWKCWRHACTRGIAKGPEV